MPFRHSQDKFDMTFYQSTMSFVNYLLNDLTSKEFVYRDLFLCS